MIAAPPPPPPPASGLPCIAGLELGHIGRLCAAACSLRQCRMQAKDTRLRTVQLEGQVILKLVKHCQECEPALVTGQLLGLDIGQTLEVTDCFPFPVRCRSILLRNKYGLASSMHCIKCSTVCSTRECQCRRSLHLNRVSEQA